MFTGTKWRVYSAGPDTIILRCMGNVEGPRFLDGRTTNGTVGLAPSADPPFTGTRWQVVPMEEETGGTQRVRLKCLGNIDGPRWLDGRTMDGSVGLAPTTEPPFTGTTWEARYYPVPIDLDED